MKIVYILVLLFYCVAGYSDSETDMEEKKRRTIEQMINTQPVIFEGYQLVSRHVGIDVLMYRSYRTVSLMFYHVVEDAVDARFTFQSEELHLNNIGSCSPQEVIVHLKHRSFPTVNPDGYSFPKNFIDVDRRGDMITLELLSDGSNVTYSMQNPKPGVWYAITYIKWEDPRTQKVEQEGLVAACNTILYTDLQTKVDETNRYINCNKRLTIDYVTLPGLYKCRAEDTLEPIHLDLNIINTTVSNNKISVRVQAESIPTENSYILHCVFDPRLSNEQTVIFYTHPMEAYFIQIDVVEGNTSQIADCESYALRDFDDTGSVVLMDLMRDDKERFFTFDYSLPTTDISDVTSLINLTSSEIRVTRFEIIPFVDIGGSLAIEASLVMGAKYYMGWKRDKQEGFTEDDQFFKVVICLDIGHGSIPLQNGLCRYNNRDKPAMFVLNSTDTDTIYDKLIIPYPEGGLWYLSMRLFCDSSVCPCRTSNNGTRYYIASETDMGSDVIREGTSNCNTTVVLSVSSTSCVSGRCSNHGNCGYNTFSGIVMSYCSCFGGYGGWDCSDDSRMDSHSYMIVAVLLLTLSNLLFLFSIYVATIRLYFIEAVMYGFTMIFSTFYHACDAPAQVAYCIIRGNVLQFGDFYCGLMSFWVTLLAMSIVSIQFRSFLQIIGAIVIALLTTWNMHSFFAFVFPVAFGAITVFLSWYLDYDKTKLMRFPKTYYTRYMPLGLVLVSVGLICYAFLQTEQNYKIVHSFWHMIIALSVVFLLPDSRRREAHPFVPSPDFFKSFFCKAFETPRNP